jgi:site-specific DNA-methyltransferase (adenine-specific)
MAMAGRQERQIHGAHPLRRARLDGEIGDLSNAIKREERIGGQRLLLGDCLEIMPQLGKFDAVITDPPYGIETPSGYGRDRRKIIGDSSTEAMRKGIAGAFAIMPRGIGVVFYSARNTPAVMAALPAENYFGEVIWNKRIPGLGAQLRYQHENLALFSFGGAKPKGPFFSLFSTVSYDHVHPHQKPLALLRYVLNFCDPADTVLDPFMGSGTTLVACQKLGRRGTGIELDPDYFEIACKRVDEATRQPDLFVEQPPAPTQEGMDI